MEPRGRTRQGAAIVLLALVAACGAPRHGQPSGTTSCPVEGSVRSAVGPPSVNRSPAVALLRNVQVQASGCADEVSFLFWGGTPGWSVGYQDGPLHTGASGAVVEAPGAAHLVVRLDPASGADTSGTGPHPTYDGPPAVTPAPPSAIARVQRLGDSESVSTWAIGLPSVRPFDVVVRGEQLVVRVIAPTRRTTRCQLAGTRVTVGYPSDWYAELSDRWACRYFDPSPFVVYPATDALSWAVSVEPADAPAPEVVARMTNGAHVVRRETRVAGIPATLLDVTASGAGLYPDGYESRAYVVASTPNAVVVFGTPAPPGALADRNRAATERMAGLLELGHR